VVISHLIIRNHVSQNRNSQSDTNSIAHFPSTTDNSSQRTFHAGNKLVRKKKACGFNCGSVSNSVCQFSCFLQRTGFCLGNRRSLMGLREMRCDQSACSVHPPPSPFPPLSPRRTLLAQWLALSTHMNNIFRAGKRARCLPSIQP